MKKFSGYEETQVYTEFTKLPVDGYVVEIQKVDFADYDWGEVMLLYYDIAEGDFKGFFHEQYKENTQPDKKYKGVFRLVLPKDDGSEKDEWSKRKFKTCMTAIEDSNSGYHWAWEESTLVGKHVGIIFQDQEWEFKGKFGMSAQPYSMTTVEKIREGSFKIPEPKFLENSAYKNRSSFQMGKDSDFSEIQDDGDLPF